MPNDPVLAILALLLMWLLLRLRQHGRSEGQEEEGGRKSVKIQGSDGVKLIESLPPRPLAFGAKISVPGPPGEEGPFQVDLEELTCTCPDFRDRRASLPAEAVGRVCLHLSQALSTTGATSSMDDLLRVIVEAGPTREVYYQASVGPDRMVAVGHTAGAEVLDIFAKDWPSDPQIENSEGPYRRYQYSRARRRWVDEERPPGSGRINQLIETLPLDP